MNHTQAILIPALPGFRQTAISLFQTAEINPDFVQDHPGINAVNLQRVLTLVQQRKRNCPLRPVAQYILFPFLAATIGLKIYDPDRTVIH